MDINFNDIFRGKVVIVGIGNPLRADDGCGPCFIDALARKQSDSILIDAGAAPESYAGKIIKENPDTVLFVDAVHLDKAPGEYALLDSDEILTTGFSTHDLSPKMFLDYLKMQTRAALYLLGVQPATLTLGHEMSEPVKAAVDMLATMAAEALTKRA